MKYVSFTKDCPFGFYSRAVYSALLFKPRSVTKLSKLLHIDTRYTRQALAELREHDFCTKKGERWAAEYPTNFVTWRKHKHYDDWQKRIAGFPVNQKGCDWQLKTLVLYWLLKSLEGKQPISYRYLAVALNLSDRSVRGIVQRLRKQGCVERVYQRGKSLRFKVVYDFLPKEHESLQAPVEISPETKPATGEKSVLDREYDRLRSAGATDRDAKLVCSWLDVGDGVGTIPYWQYISLHDKAAHEHATNCGKGRFQGAADQYFDLLKHKLATA